MLKLGEDFYTRPDVVRIARELLGKYLMTHLEGGITGGMIVETEAYEGVTDRASHAWNNRRTARTEVMYGRGGLAYVYLCYGIHSLFNIVTNTEGVPHAILVRGIFPTDGIEIMKKRVGRGELKPEAGTGPGRVSSLLGIHYSHSGLSLLENRIWIEDRGYLTGEKDVMTSARVGIDYAGPDALLPYRFRLNTAR